MPEYSGPFIPSRHVSHIALVAVAMAAITIAYRHLINNDLIAQVLGISTIICGLAAGILYWIESRQQNRKVHGADTDNLRSAKRARRIGLLGAILMLVSFIWLGGAVAFLGASTQHILLFQIWLVLYSLGFALLSFPTIRKWGVLLGFIRSNKRD